MLYLILIVDIYVTLAIDCWYLLMLLIDWWHLFCFGYCFLIFIFHWLSILYINFIWIIHLSLPVYKEQQERSTSNASLHDRLEKEAFRDIQLLRAPLQHVQSSENIGSHRLQNLLERPPSGSLPKQYYSLIKFYFYNAVLFYVWVLHLQKSTPYVWVLHLLNCTTFCLSFSFTEQYYFMYEFYIYRKVLLYVWVFHLQNCTTLCLIFTFTEQNYLYI